MSNNIQRNKMYGHITIAVTQFVAIVLLASAAMLPFATAKAVLTVCILILLALITFWPLKGSTADKAIPFLASVASMWCATLALKGWLPSSVIDGESEVSIHKFVAAIRPYERWAVNFALILVAATFVSFARQMFREDRSNLVRNLSHCLTASIACAALPGWLFLPSIIKFTFSVRVLELGVLVAILGLFVVIVLAGLSHLWIKDAQYNAGTVFPQIGTALIPIMMCGMVVYGAGLAMLLVA
ncbi:beta-carotene 15,15'-monooxygenase [Gardnerella piotii]|uniref:beta-carotene 15,15'-monooxygenase n=1 Tax=Gardnerella piotii TaxID=2792977 RepID=UPI0039EF9F3C